MSHTRLLAGALLTAALLAISSCHNNTAYEIELAPIHEVSVSIAESFPEQVIVHIQGGLRDGCTTFNDIEVSRDDFTITLTVTTRHPKDAVCPAVYTYFERNINLGSDFVRGRTYTLKVNDYTTSVAYPS